MVPVTLPIKHRRAHTPGQVAFLLLCGKSSNIRSWKRMRREKAGSHKHAQKFAVKISSAPPIYKNMHALTHTC